MDVQGEIKKIQRMNPGINRNMRIYHLDQYIQYLSDSGKVNAKACDNLRNKIQYPFYLKLSTNEDIDTSLVQLTALYEEILNIVNNYNSFYIVSPGVDYNKILPYAIEFFKYLDMDAYNLYMKMNSNNMISLIDFNEKWDNIGETPNVGNGNSYIIAEKYNRFLSIETLVHEMGHAYFNFLNKTQPNNRYPFIENECIPILFQFLFRKFLRDNHLLNSDLLDIADRNMLIKLLYQTDLAYVYNNGIFHYNSKNYGKKIPNYSDIISTVIKVSKLAFNENSILKPNKHLYSLCNEISFDSNYYSYGLLYALVMHKRFIEDEMETRKLIRNFPNMIKSCKYNEIISTFSDDEYIKASSEYIDKALSKTYYKEQRR